MLMFLYIKKHLLEQLMSHNSISGEKFTIRNNSFTFFFLIYLNCEEKNFKEKKIEIF